MYHTIPGFKKLAFVQSTSFAAVGQLVDTCVLGMFHLQRCDVDAGLISPVLTAYSIRNNSPAMWLHEPCNLDKTKYTIDILSQGWLHHLKL